MSEQQQAILQSNIRAREAAEAAMQFIESEWVDVTPRFWEVLGSLALAKLPKAPAPVAESSDDTRMDEMTAQKFERGWMPPRGIHASKQLREVPPHYLIWWLDNSLDSWTKQLARYVKSQRFQDRLRESERNAGMQ